MKDRNVQFPQRYRIQKVNGTDDVFDLIPAPGEVSDDGTFLNKATLLKDVTASLFGLGADAVPDDVLAYLGQYNQHWWERIVLTEQCGYKEVRTLRTLKLFLFYHYDNDLQYADSINIDQETGEITLVNPTTTTIPDGSTDEALMRAAISVVKGKYVTGVVNAAYSNQDLPGVFYVPTDATGYMKKDVDDGTYIQLYFKESTTYEVTSQLFNYEPGDKDMVWSTDRNAYPDSGVSGGYEWQYLGVPFENAVTAPKIVTGSYIGTGKYGTSNKNTLTFDSEPKMVFVTEEFREDDGSAYTSTGWVIFTQTDVMGYAYYNYSFGNGSYFSMTPNWGKVLKWWSTDSADVQGNTAGTKYRYVAIC